MTVPERAEVVLSGVPETALWTLWFRAVAAGGPDPLLADPRAVELVERLDFPFRERCGPPDADPVRFGAALQAARVKVFDDQVRRFLRRHPRGTVVALGEGLETQFWRVDNGRMRWLTVDLPDSVALRERLLPTDGDDRRRVHAGSATDERWLDEVDPEPGVLVTAQGLLMYLPPVQVHRLISACAHRLPGGGMLFDAMPRWMTALTGRNGRSLLRPSRSVMPVPAMPWGLDHHALYRLRGLHSNIVEVRDLWVEPGRGRFFGSVLPRLNRIPLVRGVLPSIVLLRFGAG